MRTPLRLLNSALLGAVVLLGWNLLDERGSGGTSPESLEGAGGGRIDLRPGEFLRGDSNRNWVLDLSDSVFTLTHLFSGGEAPPCLAAADTNDDGNVDISDPIHGLAFLFLGGPPPPDPYPGTGPDPTVDLDCGAPALPTLPLVGSLGGPDRELSPQESLRWRRGHRLFDRPFGIGSGLGPLFNGDSCRGCHLDPVVGGAGGSDVDVVRFAVVGSDGTVSELDGGPAVSRHSIPGFPREELPAEANVLEARQTPSLLGLGLVDRVPDDVLLALEDPLDQDSDGISGRARVVSGRVGRFGHKADIATLADFVADALANEIGITVDPSHSDFAVGADPDEAADPEIQSDDLADLTFFVKHIAPPAPTPPSDDAHRARIEQGEEVFNELGCAKCHVPALTGADGTVRAYSDFLLHDVADPALPHVTDSLAEPGEYRTAPLWGCRETAPYLHDGSAATLPEAIRGHFGEASSARDAYEALPLERQRFLHDFLRSL